ncbi:MAG: hypothetical protein ACRD4F_14310, partial [Candidatus Angelobacter sp.]
NESGRCSLPLPGVAKRLGVCLNICGKLLSEPKRNFQAPKPDSNQIMGTSKLVPLFLCKASFSAR